MKNLKVGIGGAGIQGVSNALFLQKKGFDVTIFDKDEPGSPSSILWKCWTFFSLCIIIFK